MGRGRVPGKAMVIGEAPGLREDDIGKPFAGKSGKLLDDAMSRAGLSRRDVYITNVVKCRPPENRQPNKHEIAACAPYLLKELDEVKPKFVLLLGATALKALTRKSGITTLRGKVIEKNGIKYMPAFHPAYILRNPGKEPDLVQDVKRFRDLIYDELITFEELNWHILNRASRTRFEEEVANAEYGAYDIESTGLIPQVPGFAITLFTLSFSPGSTWVLPLEIEWSPLFKKKKEQIAIVKWICWLIEKYNVKMEAHNGKYDNMCLQEYYGINPRLDFDTLLAHHVLDENSPHDLKFLARTVVGAPDYDIDIDSKKGRGTVSRRRFMDYGGKDGHYTRQLASAFRAEFRKDPILRRLFGKLVMPAARAFEKIDAEGFPIDLEKMAVTKKQFKSKREELLEQIHEMVGYNINLNSPAQVGKWLFFEEGLSILEKTPTGAPSTSETVLMRLQDEHPGVKLLMEYRGVEKMLNTYLEGWESLMVGDRCYFSTNLHGTVTGRYSSRLHQTPRDSVMRSLIIGEEEFDFVEADYSQIELRIAAHLSQDRRMLLAYSTGQDLHILTASQITGKRPEDITKEERKMAKAVNFGFIYGMGWRKFKDYARDKYQVKVTDDESEEFRDNFFDTYDAFPDWHKRQRRIVKNLGYVRTPTGRMRRLPGVYSDEKEIRAEAERQAINSPVQGFVGELKAMAVIEIFEHFQQGDVRILGEVHDSILMLVRKTKRNQSLKVVKKIMESPGLLEDFRIHLSVPIVAEFKVGSWGSGSPVEFTS